MNKKLIRLTESDAIPETIDFLSELARRLDNGLLGVEGFVGGNRMFAVSAIRSCVSTLEKICGKLYPTDAIVKVHKDDL